MLVTVARQILAKLKNIKHGGNIELSSSEVDALINELDVGDAPCITDVEETDYEKDPAFYIKGDTLHLTGDFLFSGVCNTKTLAFKLSDKEISNLIIALTDVQNISILSPARLEDKFLLSSKLRELRRLQYHLLLQTKQFHMYAGRFTDPGLDAPVLEVYTLLKSGGYLLQTLPDYMRYDRYISLNGYIQDLVASLQASRF